jgi:hypothetical protein
MAAICEAMAPASPNGNPLRMMAEQRGGNPCNPHGEHTPGHQWPKPPPNTAVHRLLTSSPAQPRASSSPPRSLLPIRATRATATRTHRRQRHRGDKQARQWPSGPDRAQTGPRSGPRAAAPCRTIAPGRRRRTAPPAPPPCPACSHCCLAARLRSAAKSTAPPPRLPCSARRGATGSACLPSVFDGPGAATAADGDGSGRRGALDGGLGSRVWLGLRSRSSGSDPEDFFS